MSNEIIAYARNLRSLARVASCNGRVVSVVWSPPTAIHIADMIERGGERSRYVAEVQAEAERLRDQAEAELLTAQKANDAADRALARAGEVEDNAMTLVEGLPLRSLLLLAFSVSCGAFVGACLAAMRWTSW